MIIGSTTQLTSHKPCLIHQWNVHCVQLQRAEISSMCPQGYYTNIRFTLNTLKCLLCTAKRAEISSSKDLFVASWMRISTHKCNGTIFYFLSHSAVAGWLTNSLWTAGKSSFINIYLYCALYHKFWFVVTVHSSLSNQMHGRWINRFYTFQAWLVGL